MLKSFFNRCYLVHLLHNVSIKLSLFIFHFFFTNTQLQQPSLGTVTVFCFFSMIFTIINCQIDSLSLDHGLESSEMRESVNDGFLVAVWLSAAFICCIIHILLHYTLYLFGARHYSVTQKQEEEGHEKCSLYMFVQVSSHSETEVFVDISLWNVKNLSWCTCCLLLYDL